MAIPNRLRLQPVRKDLLDKMLALCDSIELALESGDDASDLLRQWHQHARRTCDPYDFRTYWKAVPQETFVLEALNPPPRFDSDALYSEALEVLDSMIEGELSQAESSYYLGWLEAQFPDSNMNDLIFWPDVWFGDESLFRTSDGRFKPDADLSTEQILEYAMAKSGRRLPGAPDNVYLPFPVPGKA